MSFNNSGKVEMLQKRFTAGTRVEMIESLDRIAPTPAGTLGTVDFVDSMGTIHVSWDNGSSLGVIYGEDRFRIVK